MQLGVAACTNGQRAPWSVEDLGHAAGCERVPPPAVCCYGTGAAVVEQKRALVRRTSKLEVVVVGGVVWCIITLTISGGIGGDQQRWPEMDETVIWK